MLPDWYNEYKKLIDNSVNKYLQEYFEDEKNPGLNHIKEATLYSVQGGKRIRSILAIEFYLLLSHKNINDITPEDDIIKFCVGIELLHAYSLVHDDLPCMDDDIYRRGNLTTWKKYSEETAVLVGDLLNSLSFELISEIGTPELVLYFGKSVGLKGMLGGQVLDLYYEQNPNELTFENLKEIHNKKTGALIQMAIHGGLIISERNIGLNEDNKINNIENYLNFGKKIGLAFQIKDDLLDVEGTFKETGKSVGGENKGFVFFLGINETKNALNKELSDCKKIINGFKSEKLLFLIDYIGSRIK